MNKRQKLVQQQFLNNETAVIKRLNQVYNQSLNDINDKIKNLTFSINGLQQQYDWMDDNDPDKAKVKSMIQSKIYQKQYQEQLQSQVDGILKQMQTSQFVTVSAYLDECYNDGFVGAIFDQHGQGVPITTPINQEAMVRAVQLDSKISRGLYTRLGEDVDLLKKKITAQVSRSVATNMTYAQTAKALAGQARIGYNNAIRIARTEGHRIQTTATMDAMTAAKDRGANIVKQWDSTLDARTRTSHAVLDGEIRELNKPFSNGLDFPGDPDGAAAEVINCRCALLQRAKWALNESTDKKTGEVTYSEEGGFTKFNNFTKQVETFDSPEDYGEFKKAFFSKSNKQYMSYVEQMQDKYGTKDFAKVLDNMSEQEYKHYSALLVKNPLYNKANLQNNKANLQKVLTNSENSDKMSSEWVNDLKPRGQVKDKIPEDELYSFVANELHVSVDTAMGYVDSVMAFTDAGSGIYSEVRRYQRNDALQFMSQEEAKEISNSIETYIKKAPRWNGGTTYRGVSVSDDELSAFKQGAKLSMGGTSSWSGTESVSKDFAQRNVSYERPNSVMYHCDTQSKGTGIRHLSVYELEDEVLCSKESKYKVVRTEQGVDHITHVYLEEDDEP